MTEKKVVPNIHPKSGLSMDYRVALGTLHNFLERVEEKQKGYNDDKANRTLFLAKRSLISRRILHYDEHFNQDEYSNVIIHKNRVSVEAINGLVDRLNERRLRVELHNQNLNLDYSDLKELSEKMDSILYRGVENQDG